MAAGTPLQLTWRYEYDEAGDLAAEINVASGAVTRHQYDGQGRLVETTQSNGPGQPPAKQASISS